LRFHEVVVRMSLPRPGKLGSCLPRCCLSWLSWRPDRVRGVRHSAVLTWFDTSVSSRGRAILDLGGPDARAARNELEAGWPSNRCRDFAIIPIRWQPVWWCLAATLPAAFVAHPGTTPISVHMSATPMASRTVTRSAPGASPMARRHGSGARRSWLRHIYRPRPVPDVTGRARGARAPDAIIPVPATGALAGPPWRGGGVSRRDRSR
jgi:hypothetical protein